MSIVESHCLQHFGKETSLESSKPHLVLDQAKPRENHRVTRYVDRMPIAGYMHPKKYQLR